MGALENFLKSPSGGRSGERAQNKASEKKLFCGIKIDAIVRFGFWRRHQKWCHLAENLFCFSFLAPKRSQLPVPSRIWRQNGANLSQNLLPHLYRNLRVSKTTLFLKVLEKYFGASYLLVSGVSEFAWPLHSLTATWRAKKRHPISHFFKIFLYSHTARFWGKSKHRAEAFFFLLLYRNIQSKKVNTVSKLFPSTT